MRSPYCSRRNNRQRSVPILLLVIRMCTWLYVCFDCGITIRLPNVRYTCEDLKYSACIGRWGCHEQRLLYIPLPCMDLEPCCELCRRNTLSRRARDWYFATAIVLVQKELATTFDTIYWELYKLNPHEGFPGRVLRSLKFFYKK